MMYKDTVQGYGTVSCAFSQDGAQIFQLPDTFSDEVVQVGEQILTLFSVPLTRVVQCPQNRADRVNRQPKGAQAENPTDPLEHSLDQNAVVSFSAIGDADQTLAFKLPDERGGRLVSELLQAVSNITDRQTTVLPN